MVVSFENKHKGNINVFYSSVAARQPGHSACCTSNFDCKNLMCATLVQMLGYSVKFVVRACLVNLSADLPDLPYCCDAVHRIRRAKWAQTKLPPVWDVEEAVRLGKENQACPYYTARDSLVTADLILWWDCNP